MLRFKPSTTNAEIADAIDDLRNKLNERDLLTEDDLELLSEAADRIRELGDEED